MGKSLIIGAMTHYTFDKIKPWVKSINDCGFTGDKVMIVYNAEYSTIEKLIENGFIVIAFNKNEDTKMVTYDFGRIPVHVQRFLHIYEFLYQNSGIYDYVVTTDVKDVIFQRNPIDYLKDIKFYKFIAASEGLKYKDEPWGNENLWQTYGQNVYDKFKDNVIYNVGTLGGKADWIRDLCFHIFQNAINRPIPIVDQAVYNVIINTLPFKGFALEDDYWACQMGTTADPSKIDQFRPNLTIPEPIIKDGIVYHKNGEKFYIVHQYDRIPGLKELVESRYE